MRVGGHLQLCIFVFQILLFGELTADFWVGPVHRKTYLKVLAILPICENEQGFTHFTSRVVSSGIFKCWMELLFLCSKSVVEVLSFRGLSSTSLPGPTSYIRSPQDAHFLFCLEAGSWAGSVGLMLKLLHIQGESLPSHSLVFSWTVLMGALKLLLLAKLRILGQNGFQIC